MSKTKTLLIHANVQSKSVKASNGFVLFDNEHILKAGDMSQLRDSDKENVEDIIDLKGQLLTPGLVDCHTHLVYAGNRSQEFEMRLLGETYTSIAQKGGGITSTVKSVEEASFDSLYQQSLPRLKAMMRGGVTTVEIKSGYGLSLESELKMLRVARRFGEEEKVNIETTFLGAHTIPKAYQGDADSYIDYVCNEMMPAVASENLADCVDVFCESIAFNLAQTDKVFDKALSLGLKIKCHAEQLSNLGASALAASKGAISCDHLEFIDEKAIALMAAHQTTAVLLPGAYYFLKETQRPPIALFRRHGVNMAIATDCNPGSSPTTSLVLMMNMACVLFGLNVDEAFMAVTSHAATALKRDDLGDIQSGKRSDLVCWPVTEVVELCYAFGQSLTPQVYYAGCLRN